MKQSTMEAYAEVDAILDFMDEKYRKEIPKKLRIFFKEKKSKDYKKSIVSNKPLAEQNLSEEALAILAVLHYNYWCKDEKRKKELLAIYSENEEIYQKELKNENNNINIQKNETTEAIKEEILALVEYKEPKWYRKMFDKIKNLFRRKRNKKF